MGLSPDHPSMLTSWADGLPTEPNAGDNGLSTMVSLSSSQSRTIEERYELEVTRAGLGFVEKRSPIPVGREGRYFVEDLLGRGSMGTVYLARDSKLDRAVALKVVARRSDIGHLQRRLKREANALAGLQHENVVTVYDLAATDQGELFIAMEYVHGTTLRAWQENKGLQEILEAYLLAGQGLAAAHEAGWVHRDFKPDNVLVGVRTRALRVKVGDFGLAGSQSRPARGSEPIEVVPTESQPGSTTGSKTEGRLTSPRGLLGTAAYMAPEQLRRERADAQSDQHQFCVALWEAVTGTRPFPDEGHASERFAPARPGTMPRALHRLLCRGLSFEPADRFPSLDELLRRLRRIRGWRRARPWVTTGAVVGTALVSAVVLRQPPDPCAHTGARMAELWTSATAQNTRATLAGSDAEYVDYVVSSLENAASAWTDQAMEICTTRVETATVDAALERRDICLQRWADRMELYVDKLRDLDPSHISNAHALVAPLRMFDNACTLPAAPILAKVQIAIDRAEASELLGDGEAALRQAHEAVLLASELGVSCEGQDSDGKMRSHELAAAWFRLGHVQAEWGSAEEALETLTEAYLNALSCGDLHRYADARIHAAARLAIDHGDLEAAVVALNEADATLSKALLPYNDLHRQEYYKASGLVAQRRGDLKTAWEYYERGLALLGPPEDHPVLAAKLIANIGVVHQVAGRHADAAKSYAQATTLVAVALGPNHPQTRTRAEREALNLGLLATERGSIAEVRDKLNFVAQSADPKLIVLALSAWAQAEYHADRSVRPKRALELAGKLYDHLQKHPDLPPEATAIAMTTTGQLLAMSDDERGLTLLEDSLQRWKAIGDETSLRRSRLALAQALATFGQPSAAREHIEILRAAASRGDPEFREALKALERELATTPYPTPP